LLFDGARSDLAKLYAARAAAQRQGSSQSHRTMPLAGRNLVCDLRHRTVRSKGCLSNKKALPMIFKLDVEKLFLMV
jgi:hypothetical protein